MAGAASLLLHSSGRWRNQSLETQVHDDVSVVLVVVCGIEDEHRAARGLRIDSTGCSYLHCLVESGVGGLVVDAVAIGERILQSLEDGVPVGRPFEVLFRG